MSKRKPAYPALLVIGLGLMTLGISVNHAFIGAGVLFMIIGAVGMRKVKAEQAKRDHVNDESDRAS